MSMSAIASLILCEFSILTYTRTYYIVVVYIISPREKESWALDQWERGRDRSRGVGKGTLVLRNIKGSVGKLKGFVWK